MAAAINLPIPSAMGLPITLTLNTINLPVLISYTTPSLSLLVLGAIPGGREGTVTLENTELRSEPFPRPHTVSGRAGIGIQMSSLESRPLSPASESRMLVSVPLRSAGPAKRQDGRRLWGGCSGRGRGPWGCFSADVGSKGLRLLLVAPRPHSQFPAHRLFLFCCELQFPWVPH